MIHVKLTRLIYIGVVAACLAGITLFIGMSADAAGLEILSENMRFDSGLILGVGFACLVLATFSKQRKTEKEAALDFNKWLLAQHPVMIEKWLKNGEISIEKLYEIYLNK